MSGKEIIDNISINEENQKDIDDTDQIKTNINTSDIHSENIEEDTEDDEKDKEIKQKKAGVIYLSRIPTKMNVRIIREYFSNYGEVDRIFLEPREKKRKNEQRTFSEGWVEFKRKRDAKEVAIRLNNTQCGGKRKNPWYSELWNIKYLKKFRWTHLNERMAYEQELRKQRLRQEVNLAKKETAYYVKNFEKNERKKRLDKKGNNKIESESVEMMSTALNNEPFENKRPKLYERKTKITGNDNFLKQIFS